MKLQGSDPPRPLTHDLACSIVESLDAEISRVTVTELRENTFHAAITLHAQRRRDRDRLANVGRDRARAAGGGPDLRRGRGDRGVRRRVRGRRPGARERRHAPATARRGVHRGDRPRESSAASSTRSARTSSAPPRPRTTTSSRPRKAGIRSSRALRSRERPEGVRFAAAPLPSSRSSALDRGRGAHARRFVARGARRRARRALRRSAAPRCSPKRVADLLLAGWVEAIDPSSVFSATTARRARAAR